MTDCVDYKTKLNQLEVQLSVSQDKLLMRENVISQLEEEIKGKERLIFEQNHLISILETEAANQTQLSPVKCDNNNKYDTVSIASESEITVIEREIVASSSSSSPCSSDKSESNSSRSSSWQDDCRETFRSECINHCRCQSKFEQAMVERERLELQNEQLLKQWEESLEYVSSVQRQLQEEINRNSMIKNEMIQKKTEGTVVLPRSIVNIISIIIVIFGYLLYRL